MNDRYNEMKKRVKERLQSMSIEEKQKLDAVWEAYHQRLMSVKPGTYVLKSPEMKLAEKLGISLEEAEKHAAKMGF